MEGRKEGIHEGKKEGRLDCTKEYKYIYIYYVQDRKGIRKEGTLYTHIIYTHIYIYPGPPANLQMAIRWEKETRLAMRLVTPKVLNRWERS
jgi:hypothetical protein